MLTPRQRALLEARQNTYFILWLSRWIPLEVLNERERFLLCRDAFRLSVLSLVLLVWMLPFGMIGEAILLVLLPVHLFFLRWVRFARSMQRVRVPIDRHHRDR